MTVLADSNASMRTCKWGDSSQAFSYDSSKRAIKINGKCLDYNYSNGNVYLHSCHGKKNQVWYYDKNTYQVKSLYNENCLDLNSSSNLYMTSCNANDSQKIQVPSMWNILPLSVSFSVSCIFTLTIHSILTHPSLLSMILK